MLSHGPVAWRLTTMAASMLIGFLSAAAFNITDAYFIGLLGTREMAAISFTFPVVMLTGGLAMGIGVGATAVISQIIGRGDQREVQRLTTHSLMLALMVVAVIVVLGLLTIGPLFTLLGATDETLPIVADYMRIWYIGVMFVIVPMVGNSAIRATGDMLTPSAIMAVGLFLNIALDPLFIFGFGPLPAMGVTGAAIATVICRGVALVAALYILGVRKKMLTFEAPTLRAVWASWRRILHIALPAAGAHMLAPVSAGVITRMIAQYGTASVAAYGVGTRLEMVLALPLISMGVSMTPFVGQNWGAGEISRIYEAQRFTERFAVIWGVSCATIIGLLAWPIADLFTTDPSMRGQLVLYLCVAPWAFGFRGLGHICNSAMNGISQPLHAASAIVLRHFALTIPAALLGAWLDGYAGLLCGLVLGEVASGAICAVWARALYRRLPERSAAPPLST